MKRIEKLKKRLFESDFLTKKSGGAKTKPF